MKKILFALLVALTTLTAFATEDNVRFTSKTNGITFMVPANCKLIQDEINAVILQTPDQQYTITAEAFNVEEASKDDISNHLLEMGQAAGMDLGEADKVDNTTEWVTFSGLGYDFENGAAAVVGVAVVNETELGYYITLVAGPKYVDQAATSIVTIDFNPDAVEE